MENEEEMAREVADRIVRADEHLADAIILIAAARQGLGSRSVPVPFGTDTIDGRVLSMALTHAEDALLRLRHGAPR